MTKSTPNNWAEIDTKEATKTCFDLLFVVFLR